MSIMVTIKDESLGKGRNHSTELYFTAERMSVRELIEARITQEVEKYNAHATGEYIGLVQPTESEARLNGYSLAKGQLIDVEKQKSAAVKSFLSNGFFLLVNNRQVTNLDEEVILLPESEVNFIKLVPLVGG